MIPHDGGAGPAPTSTVTRSYGVPFSEVWDALLATANDLRGWQVLQSDPRAGSIRLQTMSRLGRAALEAELALSLDEMGQTLLRIHFQEPDQLLLRNAGRSRAKRYLERLDALLSAAGSG